MNSFLRWVNHRPTWFSLVAVTAMVGGLWINIHRIPATDTSGGLIPSPRQGFLAPEFALSTLEGESAALNDYRGQVVVVNLWATWCPPCRAEMPALQSAYEAYQDQGVVFLAVNTTDQDSQSAVQSFVNEFGLTFPVLLDIEGIVSRLYQLQALPSTFFIDRQGVIQEVVIGGPMSQVTLETAIETLISESD
jgi:cytochrome c biogenesis protein CcmG/thiol:disulfide interchange protein DsbE